MKRSKLLQHLMMLAVMLIASGGTVKAQPSDEAYEAAKNSDMGTWNFTTAKMVDLGGFEVRFKLDTNLGLAEWCETYANNTFPESLNIPKYITVDEKDYIVVSSSGYAAYEQLNTKYVSLPNTLRRVGSYTYYPFKNVKYTFLKEDVELICDNAFYGWNDKTIYFEGVVPPYVQGSLAGDPRNFHVECYVPEEGFRDYVKADGIKDQLVVSDKWNDITGFSNVTIDKCNSGELGYLVVADILPDVRTYAEVNKLTIKGGTMDESDWYALRQMPNLVYLDLYDMDIEEIPAGALDGCWQISRIFLPKKLKAIRGRALRGTRLWEITLPSGLEEITGEEVFRDCDSLKSVWIPDGVESLPYRCFAWCDKLHEVRLSENLATMGSQCFIDCDLYELELPGSLEGISSECFYSNNNLTNVTFGEGIGYVSSYAFQNCTRLGETEPIIMPSTLKTIDYYGFAYCTEMKKIIFNEGLEKIDGYAFQSCENLRHVTLPSSLIYCLYSPFRGCTQLIQISCLSLLPPTVRNIVVSGEVRDIKLSVPMWSFQEYMTTPGWLEFQQNLVIDPDIRPENVYINKEFEFVLGEDQNLKDYEPNIRMFYNTDDIDDGFGHTKYERGNLTISNRSKLKINDFSMYFSPYAKYHADYNHFYYGVDYDASRTQYNPNSLIVRGELRAEDQTINLMLRNDTWQFISFPFDVNMSDIVPEDNLTQWVVRYYDGAERAAQNFGNTWKNLTASDVLEAGKGYIMKCYLNNPKDNLVCFTVTPVTESTNRQKLFTSEDVTTTLADYPTQNQLLTSDRSWNLIGNPYPCYYDTRYIDTEAPFLVWDSYYQKYVAFSPVDDNYVLNPGEAFFIQRPIAGDGNLTFRKGGRQTHRNPNDLVVQEAKEFAFGKKSSRTVLNITLTGEETSDRTRVVFNDKAEMGYEVSRDAALFAAMSAEASQIWSVNGNVKYAINERPMGDGIVELGITCGKTGTYTIALGQNNGAESVVLVDRQTGKKTEISTEQGYTFQASAGDITGRFYLSGGEVDGIRSIDNGQLTIDNEGEGAVYDLSGRRVNADEKGIVIKNGTKMLNK